MNTDAIVMSQSTRGQKLKMPPNFSTKEAPFFVMVTFTVVRVRLTKV